MATMRSPALWEAIKKQLEKTTLVSQCTRWYGNTGDLTSIKMCCLLCRQPDLSVSQLAELAGVSVWAASRCLKKPHHSQRVSGRKEGQTVHCSLEGSDFIRWFISQLARGGS